MPPSIPESAQIEAIGDSGIRPSIFRRLWQEPRARWALLTIAVLSVAAVLGPLLLSFAPDAQIDIVHLKNAPPSWVHPLGTDNLSQDLLARILSGARVSLAVGALAVLLSTTLGTAYGLVTGYLGGVVDAGMMRFLDALLAIPRLLIVIAASALWSQGPTSARASSTTVILIIGLTGWFGVSRLVRAEVRSVKHRDFILAARGLGASTPRIVVRYLLPNVAGPVIVASTLGIANVIAIETALSYLGYGIPAPHASWGTILQDAMNADAGSRWPALPAAVAIVVTVLAFNVLGDALRDVLDSRQLGQLNHQ